METLLISACLMGFDCKYSGGNNALPAESLAALLLELGTDIGRMRDAGQHAMDEIYISWEESVKHAYDLYGEILENKERGVYQSTSACPSWTTA